VIVTPSSRRKHSWKLYYHFSLDNMAVPLFALQTQTQERREEESETNRKAKNESQKEKSSRPRTGRDAGTNAASRDDSSTYDRS
jgi:hypothetical protein